MTKEKEYYVLVVEVEFADNSDHRIALKDFKGAIDAVNHGDVSNSKTISVKKVKASELRWK